MAQDVYNANTGQAINNGSTIVNVGGWEVQSYEDRAYHIPTIDTLSGQHQSKWIYPRYYAGDTDN